MSANNRGKVKKKCRCFIYNPTPDYKSNKNPSSKSNSSKNKSPWIYHMSFSILGNNYR